MVEEWPTVSDGKKLKVIGVVLVVVISILCIASISLSAGWIDLSGWMEELQPKKSSYTTFFTSISPDNVQAVINSNVNLTVVDVRGCECSYDKGHIPNAIWDVSPRNFFNTTNDLLVYCQDGIISLAFCEKLVDHTYGALYCLEDGLDAWENAGYETTTLS